MKSYQMLTPPHDDETMERIVRVAEALYSQGHIIIGVKTGTPPTIIVKPAAATRLLVSVCTGQGGAAGQMYRSYAAILDGVQVVWRKPMRIPNIIYWPSQGKHRGTHPCTD